MKINHNYKSQINYFKKTDTLKYVGGILASLGVFLYIFGWSYVSYIIATAFLPAGGLLFLIGSSGRANDSDIDEYISKRTEGIEIYFKENVNVKKRLLKQLQVECIQGYEYKDGTMVTKTTDGSLRTSEYTKTLIYPLADAIYIVSRSISLISDETHDTAIELLYSEIKDIKLERNEKRLIFGKKSFKVNEIRFVIEYADKKIISLPASDNAALDSFMEKIKRMMSN